MTIYEPFYCPFSLLFSFEENYGVECEILSNPPLTKNDVGVTLDHVKGFPLDDVIVDTMVLTRPLGISFLTYFNHTFLERGESQYILR